MDLKPTCRARAPTGPRVGNFCTADGHSSASLPSPPDGHSWTHTPQASWPRAWRANTGRAWRRERSLHQPPKLSPPQDLLCCKSACICSPDPEDRPAGNRGSESHIEIPFWDPFLPCSEQMTSQSMLPSPQSRLRGWGSKEPSNPPRRTDVQPWSGVCAHHPPGVTAHSQHIHICPLQPLLGKLPEPPLRGPHLPSFTRTLVSQFCFWDHLQGLWLWRGFSLRSPGPLSWITRTTCLSTPSSDQKGPLGPRAPWLCLGRSVPSSLVLPSHVPCRVIRSSHCRGRLSVLGRPPWCQAQETTGTCGASPPSTAASSCLLTSSLWMGPGWAQGPHRGSWFSSHPSAAHGGVTKLLCACCAERVLVHTPLTGAQGSGGRLWEPGEACAASTLGMGFRLL